MKFPRLRGPAAVVVVAAVAAGLLRGEPPKDPDPAKVAALVTQLGDPAYARREAASRDLHAMGEKVLPALRAAAAAGDTPEVRHRANRAMWEILRDCRKTSSIGLTLALIPPGELMMGSPRNERDRRADEQQHRVRITEPFLMGVHEVTQDEFRVVTKRTPSWFALTGGGKDRVAGDTGPYPVESVTWFDAVDFCNRLSVLDGFPPYYKIAEARTTDGAITAATVTVVGGPGYRLPTEAEWEYACRAGSPRPFHFGTQNSGREANLQPSAAAGGYGGPPTWSVLNRTTRVGSYPPNRWGLHDMHGNAAEWCQDWYDRDYAEEPIDNPTGPATGTHRVQRGGSWQWAEGNCRSASRMLKAPGDPSYTAGFRVARTP